MILILIFKIFILKIKSISCQVTKTLCIEENSQAPRKDCGNAEIIRNTSTNVNTKIVNVLLQIAKCLNSLLMEVLVKDRLCHHPSDTLVQTFRRDRAAWCPSGLTSVQSGWCHCLAARSSSRTLAGRQGLGRSHQWESLAWTIKK